MTNTTKIDVKDQDLLTMIQELFRFILALGDISAILVPMHLPMKNVVMPMLVTDPESLDRADPLAPSFPMNSAKVVSKLTRRPLGRKIAIVLRSCEIRAFIELVKLKQGNVAEIVIIGIDCLGAYKNADYSRFTDQDGFELTRQFCENVLSGKGAAMEGADLSSACLACEHPVPEGADVIIGLFGVDTKDHLLVQSKTQKGEDLLTSLNLSDAEEPQARKQAVSSLIKKRRAYRDKMFETTREASSNIEKLTAYLAQCVNCYNCRVACPVCYCRECVFVTDVFEHEPLQYLQWAERKREIKIPTDTVFFHITRMAHMSLACVGCGQCSNACPNDIPLTELFRNVAHKTQQAFDYEAGRSFDETPPLSVFDEDEYKDVVGIS